MSFWMTIGVYVCLTVGLLVLSFCLRGSWIRLLVRLIAGFLILVSAAIGAILIVVRAAQPPTLAKLQRAFPKNRSNLETILSMSDEDAQFGRIAPDFLWRDAKGSDAGGEFFFYDPKSDLAKPRWEQYRDLYHQSGIKLGILRDKESDAFIMVDSIGLLNRGHTTGYLYCSADPRTDADRFEPCTLHQDNGEREYSAEPRVEAYSFQRLDSRWFAFDQGPS